MNITLFIDSALPEYFDPHYMAMQSSESAFRREIFPIYFYERQSTDLPSLVEITKQVKHV